MNSEFYIGGLLLLLAMLAVMIKIFDHGQFFDTLKAYYLHSGILSAAAWFILFLVRW